MRFAGPTKSPPRHGGGGFSGRALFGTLGISRVRRDDFCATDIPSTNVCRDRAENQDWVNLRSEILCVGQLGCVLVMCDKPWGRGVPRGNSSAKKKPLQTAPPSQPPPLPAPKRVPETPPNSMKCLQTMQARHRRLPQVAGAQKSFCKASKTLRQALLRASSAYQRANQKRESPALERLQKHVFKDGLRGKPL